METIRTIKSTEIKEWTLCTSRIDIFAEIKINIWGHSKSTSVMEGGGGGGSLKSKQKRTGGGGGGSNQSVRSLCEKNA